jgi:FixJ family two-component response regulator/HPt (histidine-containing phosphotransfer) domain-containing protein
LQIEKGESLSSHFDGIFRAVHSIKGGAGMLGMTKIQHWLHEAESRFQSFKGKPSLPNSEITYLLKTIDNTRNYLEGQEDAEISADAPAQTGTPAAATAPEMKVTPALAPTSAPKSKTSSSEAVVDRKPLRAVVLDDEEDIVEIIGDILERAQFKVHRFTDARKALQEMQKLEVDVILSDMKMPAMTGLDFLKQVNAGKRPCPVIFVSGHLDREILIEAINAGADGVVEKPFDDQYVVSVATQSAKRNRLTKLLDKSINLLMYQYSDFDDYLKDKGKEEVRKLIEIEMSKIIEQRRTLKEIYRR